MSEPVRLRTLLVGETFHFQGTDERGPLHIYEVTEYHPNTDYVLYRNVKTAYACGDPGWLEVIPMETMDYLMARIA